MDGVALNARADRKTAARVECIERRNFIRGENMVCEAFSIGNGEKRGATKVSARFFRCKWLTGGYLPRIYWRNDAGAVNGNSRE